jgi:hypothetical protein
MFYFVFQIPESLNENFPNNSIGINGTLKIILMGLLLILSVISWNSAKNAELKNIKMVEKTRALFALLYFFARLFFYLAVRYNEGLNYDFWTNMGYLAGFGGLTMYVFSLEKYSLSRIPIFTLYGIAITFLTLTAFENLIPGIQTFRESIMPVIYFSSSLLGLFLIYLYIELLSKFPGKLRKRTSYEIMGVIFFAIGLFFDGQYILSNPSVPMYYKEVIGPLLIMMGLIMVAIAHTTAEKLLPITLIFAAVLAYMFLAHLGEFYQ